MPSIIDTDGQVVVFNRFIFSKKIFSLDSAREAKVNRYIILREKDASTQERIGVLYAVEEEKQLRYCRKSLVDGAVGFRVALRNTGVMRSLVDGWILGGNNVIPGSGYATLLMVAWGISYGLAVSMEAEVLAPVFMVMFVYWLFMPYIHFYLLNSHKGLIAEASDYLEKFDVGATLDPVSTADINYFVVDGVISHISSSSAFKGVGNMPGGQEYKDVVFHGREKDGGSVVIDRLFVPATLVPDFGRQQKQYFGIYVKSKKEAVKIGYLYAIDDNGEANVVMQGIDRINQLVDMKTRKFKFIPYVFKAWVLPAIVSFIIMALLAMFFGISGRAADATIGNLFTMFIGGTHLYMIIKYFKRRSGSAAIAKKAKAILQARSVSLSSSTSMSDSKY